MVFETKSGSRYFTDSTAKTISGGKLTEPVSYTHGSAIIGAPAVFYLANGRILRTSTVTKYVM